jgi:hypothetical protein
MGYRNAATQKIAPSFGHVRKSNGGVSPHRISRDPSARKEKFNLFCPCEILPRVCFVLQMTPSRKWTRIRRRLGLGFLWETNSLALSNVKVSNLTRELYYLWICRVGLEQIEIRNEAPANNNPTLSESPVLLIQQPPLNYKSNRCL